MTLLFPKSVCFKLCKPCKFILKRFHEKTCLFNPLSQERKNSFILGIETSCDETGAAVVDSLGQIHGEGLHSQSTLSLRMGGVVPSIARKVHAECIEDVVKTAMFKADMRMEDLDALAVTVKPGFRRSLIVGLDYARKLAFRYNKPLIPIHHMEAHALTVRMHQKLDFPFLVLLISGGHCILCLAQDIEHWLVLNEAFSCAPGTAFDQFARRLKLKNIKEFSEVCGGKAIEQLATRGDPFKYSFYKHSQTFNFGAIKKLAVITIKELEIKEGIIGGQVLPQIANLSASFQHCVTKHLIRQTHKIMKYIEYKELLNEDCKSLVISGGVACNQYIRSAFEKLCQEEHYKLFLPSAKLCSDNGIMIAWNGIERWKRNKGILYDPEDINCITVEKKCPLGPSISEEIKNSKIKKPAWVYF